VSEAVLDSSAVLSLLFAEPGADRVRAYIPAALISSVNFAEVISKLCERGVNEGDARAAVERLGLVVVDFTMDQAALVGGLRPLTRKLGLSLGDRACLVLSRQAGLPALTADSAWTKLPGFDVIPVRDDSSRV